jgi:hypothetical protein
MRLERILNGLPAHAEVLDQALLPAGDHHLGTIAPYFGHCFDEAFHT